MLNTRSPAANAPELGDWIWRWGSFSGRVSPRRLAVLLLVLAAISALALAALAWGELRLGPAEVLRALQGEEAGPARFLVRTVRLPRVLAALVIGTALGLSGALLQTLARNRLASPDALGISDGATLALGVTLLWSPLGLLGPWWHALVGALLSTGLVLAAAGGIGSRGYRVLIVGLGFASLFKAGQEVVLATVPLQHGGSLYLFSIGSLVGRGREVLEPAAWLLGVSIGVLLPLARTLGLLALPDEVARGLGVRLGRARLAVVALAAALAGLAVSIAGPIGFVALAAPILARRLCGPGAPPLAAAALLGALLTLGADTLGRLLAPPVEIPAGAVTGMLGGPFLLWVLFARDRGRGE